MGQSWRRGRQRLPSRSPYRNGCDYESEASMRAGRLRAAAYGLMAVGLVASAVAQSPSASAQAGPPPRPAEAQGGAAPSASAPSEEGALSPAEVRQLLEAARATAKASRENVDYARVVPDILTQILAKLDKLEDKLGKLEDAVKAQNAKRR